MKVVFFGTPAFASETLKAFHNKNGHKVIAVVSIPDQPVGRGRKLMPTATKLAAQELNIPVIETTNLKDPVFIKQLSEMKAEAFVVLAFKKLPREVWEMPPKGCFNLHASLLPQYRGAAPINWAIINGEKKSGLTSFLLDEGIDTGNILLQKSIVIEENDTALDLYNKMLAEAPIVILQTLDLLSTGNFTPKNQEQFPIKEALQKAPKLNDENTRIHWTLNAAEIIALIKGLYPKPTAWTMLKIGNEELKCKIYSATNTSTTANIDKGNVLIEKTKLLVATADNFIEITELQLPGKKVMKIRDFLNGKFLSEGDHFF